jgi:hypothetical protein
MASRRNKVTINRSVERHLLGEHGPLADALEHHFAPHVVAYQQTHAHVDTGRMRDSVTVTRGEQDGLAFVDIGPTARDPETDFPYPVDQEHDDPFIRPSLDALPEN